MTIKKIDNFNFPVGEKQLSQDAYYKALSEASSGFYPFGENGIWHGGIHIDEGVLKRVENDNKLRSMANGEVVAYRVDNIYSKIEYQDNNQLEVPYRDFQKVAYFSTGFTLVRHLLQMPKIANSTQPPPSITLYSLYMHQLDWYGYQQKGQERGSQVDYPHYWQAESGKVNDETAETIIGSVIREKGKNTKVVGLLLKGSKVRLGEQKEGKSGWYKIMSITAGTVVTPNGFQNELGNIRGYVWQGDIGATAADRPTGNTAEANKDYEICKEENNRVGNPEVEVKGIAVYGAADATQKLTYLPKTARFEFDGQENGYAKIRRIIDCAVPGILVVENGGDDAPHKGYVKLTSLRLTHLKPEKLDEVVVLDKPMPIEKGRFIGYLGHNVRQRERFDEPKEAPLSSMKRALDTKLPPLAHVELFTCDDLPAFITKTRALADQLPESEKTIILVEKGARLTQTSPSNGRLSAGMGIHFTGDTESYYIKVKASYTFTIPSISFDALRTRPLLNTDVGKISTGVNGKIHPKDKQPQWYSLTSKDKEYLMNTYLSRYPELTLSDIPDIVELISNGKDQYTTLLDVYSNPVKDDNFFTIRFIIENKLYWIESDKVLHLKGQDGQLTSSISYWNDFPLSFDSRSPSIQEKKRNTVCYPRAVSLSLLEREGLIAIDDEKAKWVQVTALDEQTFPIQGWVNIKQNVQAHIKLVSPWHWTGFETIEEKATVGELSDKLGKNKVAKLDLDDYTPAMRALHQILTGTLIYSTQRKKDLPPPTFTDSNLKEGLRRSWTAEQIGHLLVRYESEWYADAALSKWNEIDELFEEEKRQQKALIEEGLDKLGITRPYQRDFAMEKVDEAHEYVKSNWQREKEQRIKPSLWWQQVAQAQAQAQNQTVSTEQSEANSSKLTNLSTDGKAWFIHPVAMVGYFAGIAERAAIVTYHIYHNGKIEKHIPQEILKGYEQKYKYVYHDKNNSEHEICIVDWHTTKKKRDGVTVSAPNRNDPNIIEYKENVNEGNTQKRVKYANGNIAEYGKHPKRGLIWRLYRALDEDIEIVRMPDEINYTKGTVTIKYRFSNTKRRYTGPGPLAGFIGALAEIGFELTTTGSCFYEASCFPSAEHVNGKSVDTLYKLDVKQDQKTINAMAKFHFNERLIGIKPYFYKLSNAVNKDDLHNTHLHSGDFDFNHIKEIEN